MAKCKFSKSESGFSIVEVIFATGILATAVVALAQMFTISVQNNVNAKTGSYTTTLAEQKMEQLRGLTYGFDTIGLPLTDTTTDTTSPTLQILSPSAAMISTSASVISLSGSASDNVGVVAVRWSNTFGAVGDALGTAQESLAGLMKIIQEIG